MSSNEVVARHIHKLVQVVYLCKFCLSFSLLLYYSDSWIFFSGTGGDYSYYFDLSYEVKAASVGSRVETLEVKNSKLRKDLIAAMDKANTAKEKAKVLFDDLRAERRLTLEKDKQLLAAKEKIKTIVAKSVEAFQ